MRKLYVPISALPEADDARIIQDLHDMGAERVFLVHGEGRLCLERGEVRTKQLENIKKKTEIYTAAGFEVGIWIESFGFGCATLPYNKKVAEKYVRIKSTRGYVADDAICPLDENFTNDFCSLVEDIASTGIKIIMLDDEFCLNIRPGLGCACDLHLQKLREELGEDIALEDINKKVYSGNPSKYRDAWIKVMGDSLRDFVRKVRESADRVDPAVCMGFCSGYTSWDLEGADAVEITEILAGDNKPFLRFTGAPYWVPNVRFQGQALPSIIETVRMQNAWIDGLGYDAFGEGDVYPRSRFHTPAAYSELYDMALMTEGIANLKYFYCYSAARGSDPYYVEAHKRNMPLYEKIDSTFGGKRSVGVRVFEEMRKFKNYELPTGYTGGRDVMFVTMFSDAAAMLSAHAIPTVYGGEGICGICFGENARYVSEHDARQGLIIDAAAAEILESRGIDVGLISAVRAVRSGEEVFADGEDIPLINSPRIRLLELKDGTEVLSRFRFCREPETLSPSSYRYENADGARFLVFGFAGDEQASDASVMMSSKRAEQIKDMIPWLCGKDLPLRTKSSPYLYSIVRENGNSLSAAYFNAHADEVFDLEISTPDGFEDVEFINCSGTVADGKTVRIDCVKAFGFAGVNLTRKEKA